MNKRVLMIASDCNSTSGAFRSMTKLCQLLHNYEFKPLVVIPYHADGEELLKKYGIEYVFIRSYDWIVPIDFQWTLKRRIEYAIKYVLNRIASLRISVLIKKEKIDILHINTLYSYVGAYAAKSAKIPFVWHIRELLEEDQNRRFLYDSAISLICQSNAVIAISDYVYHKFEKKLEGSNLLRIYNGLDEEDYYIPVEMHQYPTADHREVHFICVGNMHGGKGQDLIIQAASLLKQHGRNNFHIDFIGDGAFRNDYEKMILKMNLQDKITLHGSQKELKPFYQNSDVMLMSSTAEAFGRTTVEAMMAGCMIIASNSGASPELLCNGKYGLLFEYKDAHSLCEKMILVLDQPQMVAEYAKAGQKYALNTFTAKQNAECISKLYQTILMNKM